MFNFEFVFDVSDGSEDFGEIDMIEDEIEEARRNEVRLNGERRWR